MKADFALIERAALDVIASEKRSPTVERTEVVTCIAGFHMPDPVATENRHAKDIDDRMKFLQRFEAERATAISSCKNVGIKPLAVVPTMFFRNLCRASGLYRLVPNGNGKVTYNQHSLVMPFQSPETLRTGNYDISSGARAAESFAKKNWSGFLDLMWPNGESGVSKGNGVAAIASLVLPTPPADVAKILYAARGLTPLSGLRVAAVADAIGFKETPTQLYANAIAQIEAEQRALRDDPIIYFEQGTAACIIAQFGDFPVERQLVETLRAKQGILRLMPDAELRA